VDHGNGPEWKIEAVWDTSQGKESAVRFARTLAACRRIVFGFKMKWRMGEYG